MRPVTRVCFAAHEGYLGCVTSCRNAAAVLGGTWAELPRKGEPPPAVLEAELVLLSSWHESYASVIENRSGPTAVRWHSPVLQTELGREGWKIEHVCDLVDAGAIAGVAVNDAAFVDVLARPGVVFMPDVLDGREYDGVEPAPLEGVNVSLFGAGHLRKNIFVQTAAFVRAHARAGEEEWRLHLNGQSERAEYMAWLEAARVPFVEHGSLDRRVYLSLVAGMSAGLSVTLSESYCYGAADHVALGVPAVTSSTVACVDGDELCVSSPGDVEEVADTLLVALERPGLAARQGESLSERAAAHAGLAAAALAQLREACLG